ncbi:beta-ketoacyl synthase N-terminal-like domain-containing protein [Streptomyces malaysiensis subsp. malaysiensis]
MSTTATATRGPVIAGWSAVSPYGIGRDAFVEGARSGRSTATASEPGGEPVPDERVCLARDLVIKEVLGRKGTRSMDRVTGLAVATVRELVTGEEGAAESGADVALVLGTTTGSAQSMMDITRDTLIHEKPFYIDPSHIPNAIMNCPAGQCAIWYGLKGPNTTVAAGRSSGLIALNYARRLLASGRAMTVLCGAVEEYSPARAWLEWHTRGEDETGVVLGEGCAVLRLRPAEAVADGEGSPRCSPSRPGWRAPTGRAPRWSPPCGARCAGPGRRGGRLGRVPLGPGRAPRRTGTDRPAGRVRRTRGALDPAAGHDRRHRRRDRRLPDRLRADGGPGRRPGRGPAGGGDVRGP